MGTHVPPLLTSPLGQTHVVPEHTPPVGHVTQLPPQLTCPVGQTHVVPEHTPPVGHVTHVPPQHVCPKEQHVVPHAAWPCVQATAAVAHAEVSECAQAVPPSPHADPHGLVPAGHPHTPVVLLSH